MPTYVQNILRFGQSYGNIGNTTEIIKIANKLIIDQCRIISHLLHIQKHKHIK
jgi:hypothetical protein